MSDLQMYDDEAARLQAAFEAYRTVYATMHTPPEKEIEKRAFWLNGKTVAMFIGLIGSIIVSASHSVPVLVGVDSIASIGMGWEFLVGVAAFCMVEIMGVTFSYNATEDAANKDTAQQVNRNTRYGKWFVVFIMVIFNIYYVLSSNGVVLHDWIRISIFLTIATSAPIVALLTGEIWAIDKLKHDAKLRKQKAEFSGEYKAWQEGLINSWNSKKKKWGGQVSISVQKEYSMNNANELRSLPHSMNGSVNGANEQSYSTNTGYSKKMNARDIISQWFQDNPEYIDSDDTVDDVHQLVMNDTGQKVGRTSVYNVRKEMS